VVALPLIALLITALVPMPAVIAVGLLVVALCPAGPSSSLITYLARGDVALSLTLVASGSLISVFTIPVLTPLVMRLLLVTDARISLPIGPTMLRICLITLVPTAIGMALRRLAPRSAQALERQVSRLAVTLLVLIILVVVGRDGEKLPGFLLQAGAGVILLNGLGTLVGYLTARGFGLPREQQVCLTVAVGIRNGALALAITAGLLGRSDLAVPAAVYSLWMSLTGLVLIALGRRAAAAACAHR
jgi:BASS family bile acid:Na+ symporter